MKILISCLVSIFIAAGAISLIAPNCYCESADAIVQAVYTTDENGNAKRVFKVNSPIRLHVVVRNMSSHPIVIDCRDLNGVITGEKSNIKDDLPAAENDTQVQLQSGESHCFVFHFKGYNPKWYSDAFPFVGDKLSVTLAGGTRWDFYVDEFGIPDWVRTTSAVVLGKFGADCIIPVAQKGAVDWNTSRLMPFLLFEKGFYENLLDDLAKSGIKAVFIVSEFYNYGTLEGGVHYFDCTCHDLTKCAYRNEPYLHYWFPAGPASELPSGQEEYNYLTPPLLVGALPNLDKFGRFTAPVQYPPIEERRELIRQFVRYAHSKGIKVIAYVDFLGIYDPDAEVSRYEMLGPCLTELSPAGYGVSSILQKSGTSLPEDKKNDPSWVRLDSQIWLHPIRVNFVDNLLRTIKLRDLNPENYAVAPSLYDPAEQDDPPAYVDPGTGLDRSSYRDYIASQLGQLVRDQYYDFDGVFCDDIGRFAQRPCNVSIPWGEAPNPPIIYSCEPSSWAISFPLSQILTHHNCTFDEKDCWREYLYGCQPVLSLYAQDIAKDVPDEESRNKHIRGAIGEFLRYCRYRIKTWGGDEKALISSDYYVPWAEIAANEDASSTDLYPIPTPYQAQWCEATHARSFKGLRLDFNPRCNTESELIKLAQIGIAWANGCSFWFGGDKTGMDDLLTALEESGKENNDSTRFSSSPYARYARFYEAWKDTLADPLLATVYHSMTNNFDDNGNAGLTLTPNPDGLYVVAQSKPCEYGEDYRLVYLIATRDIDPTERTIKVDLPLPAGERVKSVVLLSPNFVSERESKYGRAIPEQSEAGSGAVASYATEKNALSIVLGNFNNFSILLIHFEDMFSTRLSIESTYPLDGDLDVPCTDSVAVTFDKPIATSTVNEKSFRLSFDDRMVEGRYELSNEDRTVVLKPRKPLQENSMHSVTITTNIASTDEKTLTGDTSWSFLTAIKEPPRGKKAYDYGFYAAQAVMWSQVNHDKLQGFWSFGFALRDNRGLGWTWADMNPRSSEGSSFSFQNAFVMFRLAKDLYLPGGDYQSESNNDIYLLAGFQRMAISYHDHEEWRVSSQSPKIYRKNSVVMEEELYKPAFGFGWIMMELDRSTVSCSSLLFTPFENLNWGIQINSFAGFGIAPYADVIIALFFSDNPKFSNYGLGMGVQFGF